MIRRPPRSTHCISSAASDVYKRQLLDEEGDDSLFDYLVMSFSEKQGQELNAKLVRRLKEMEVLNAEAKLAKLQSSYVLISPENVCRVCGKKLASARTLHIFPNGIVTHTGCGKRLQVCPVTGVKFAKKIYF
eukprot:TRINITY_DN9035_c0_g1_i3.p1 TRINITY_DN9035_c0_g1~~TRINITY_DN9035_c0_g1_i3.p1  ORF type:complete len:140 (+),score=53.16 TRINITY_DN9035_c0_g1_i3:26-421(+)